MDEQRTATRVVHAGRPARTPGAAVNPSVQLSSTYVSGGEVGYARTSTQTWEALEQAVGELEGGRARCFPSGLAAVNAVLETVPVGGTVVAPRIGYNGTLARLAAWAESKRIGELRQVDITDTEAIAAAAKGADLVWCESPSNPAMEVADLAAIATAAHAGGARCCVDNTVATFLRQHPLELGADVVIHSATKFIAGHSDVLAGVVVTGNHDDGEQIDAQVHETRTHGGAILGPFEAWLVLRGLRTMALRLNAAEAAAGLIAERAALHPAVSRVRYPGLPDDPGHALAGRQMSGFGALLAIEVTGGAAAADAVCAGTRIWTHATSLGGVESLLERRRHWPDEPRDVPESLIRLSVGIEDADDLWDDLSQALDAAR